jgi:hypothetical protein
VATHIKTSNRDFPYNIAFIFIVFSHCFFMKTRWVQSRASVSSALPHDAEGASI